MRLEQEGIRGHKKLWSNGRDHGDSGAGEILATTHVLEVFTPPLYNNLGRRSHVCSASDSSFDYVGLFYLARDMLLQC